MITGQAGQFSLTRLRATFLAGTLNLVALFGLSILYSLFFDVLNAIVSFNISPDGFCGLNL